MYFFFLESPCDKPMTNGEGVHPATAFDGKPAQDGQGVVYTPKSAAPNGDKPTFQKVTTQPDDKTSAVEFTPVNKDGTPVGETKRVPVEKSDKPTDVTFDKFIPSDSVLVTFVPKTPGQVPEGKVISFVACVANEGSPNVLLWQMSFYGK